MSKDSGECGELFVSSARIGLAGFGGVLPFAHRELVERKRWLSEAEFSEVLGLGQILPGSNIVNLTVMVGLQRGGGPAPPARSPGCSSHLPFSHS